EIRHPVGIRHRQRRLDQHQARRGEDGEVDEAKVCPAKMDGAQALQHGSEPAHGRPRVAARGEARACSRRSPRLTRYVAMCAAASELTSSKVEGAWPKVAASINTAVVCTPRPLSA